MHKEHHLWHSPALGRDMPVSVYGHWGVPLLVFPTAGSDCDEYERMGLIGAIAPHIDGGRVKLFCINTINGDSWFHEGIPPAERAHRQCQYDKYIMDEVVPFIYDHCHGTGPICTVGASMGSYHALNEQLKHPEVFRWSISMSGIYDLRRYMDGFYNDDCYFNNPPDYVGGTTDDALLERLRACSINIIVGRGPWEHVEWAESMAQALWAKSIPANLDLWGYDVAHDWPWWNVEMNTYISRLFGG